MLVARIHKITGQTQAIEKMIAKKRSCEEVLHQISAARAGIEQLANIVFRGELEKISKRGKINSVDIEKLTDSYSQTT